ncbi:hypothetical protein ACLKA6_013228 [Drosophila palustris]
MRLIAQDQGECPKTKQETIEEFRKYILEHKKCQPHRNDDRYLEKFCAPDTGRLIAATNGSVAIIKSLWEENKKYYEKVRPIDLRHVGDEEILTVTPYRDQQGMDIDDIFEQQSCCQRTWLLEPISQIVGGVAIFGSKDLGLEHLLHLSPSVAQKMIALLVTSMPIRTAALHIVNQNWVFNAAIKIFKPFSMPPCGSDFSYMAVI